MPEPRLPIHFNGENPKPKHRFSYEIDVVRKNNSADGTPLRFVCYYINRANPLTGRFIALQLSLKLPTDPTFLFLGKFFVQVFIVDEQQHESRMIFDADPDSCVEICKNLENEYNQLKKLGYDITDWEIVHAPDGNDYRAIRSVVRLEQLFPCLNETDLKGVEFGYPDQNNKTIKIDNHATVSM
jgi:hypothetical protein